MKITYIRHSAFLVETPNHALLFDCIGGSLPPLPQKPLSVFASHSHADHFDKIVYSLPADHFFLSQDIKRKGFPPALADRISFVKKDATLCVGGIEIQTLRSTDQGVAFLLRVDGADLYHAGDLNHWHWEGEPEEWNRQMAEKYRTEMQKLQGRHFSAAFIPLDPRLGKAFDLGMLGFFSAAQADAVFPMHMWDDYSVITRFCQMHPGHPLVDIREENQQFIIE